MMPTNSFDFVSEGKAFHKDFCLGLHYILQSSTIFFQRVVLRKLY